MSSKLSELFALKSSRFCFKLDFRINIQRLEQLTIRESPGEEIR